MDVLTEFELYEYAVRENGKLTGETVRLGLHEAKKINYAFALNRSPKRYVRIEGELHSQPNTKTLLITPPKG